MPTKPGDYAQKRQWILTAKVKRNLTRHEDLSLKSKVHPQLTLGAANHHVLHEYKWGLSGTVGEFLGQDSYNVCMDGGGKVTKTEQ